MSELKIDIPSGTYVIAVSGGVDSMTLLDILAKKPELNLIVAHFDHGIRQESFEDRQLVQKTARKYGLPFVYDKVALGIGASESEARKVRYKFLDSVKNASGAQAIITAHHQDDVIETAIHNLLRGTNRKGLSSLKSIDGMIRPMTHIDKQDIYSYAKSKKLIWNEDYTNQDTRYKRNYIRHKIVPRFSFEHRQKMVDLLKKSAAINDNIDNELELYLSKYAKENKLSRYYFNILPHAVATEVMATWLRQNDIRDFDTKLIDKLTIGSKTMAAGKRLDVDVANFLEINKDFLALIRREC